MALRSTRHTSATLRPALSQCSTQLQRRWNSGRPGNDEGNAGRDQLPFNHQIFGSITKRVQKEKAQMQEVAALQHRTARGRFFAAIVCA
jgi:hypothetical protein